MRNNMSIKVKTGMDDNGNELCDACGKICNDSVCQTCGMKY